MKDNEVEFIGKITAGITHEVNNVLASIREISGLMTDIMSITDEKSFRHKEKFQTSLQKIQNQVQRGVKLTSQLNKFSHLSDNTKTDIDLNDLIEHLVFLTERFARIKNVALVFQPLNHSLAINVNPLHMQMALFNCIAYLLNQMINGGEISIYPEKNENQFLIKVICKGELKDKMSIFKDASTSDSLLSLNQIMETLGGGYQFDESAPGIIIQLSRIK